MSNELIKTVTDQLKKQTLQNQLLKRDLKVAEDLVRRLSNLVKYQPLLLQAKKFLAGER